MANMGALVPSIILGAFGLLLVLLGLRLPLYSDSRWQEPFYDREISLENLRQTKRDWRVARDAARTNRVELMDAGFGFIALGLSVAVLFRTQGIRRLRDVNALATPRTRRRIVLMAVAAWLSFVPAVWAWLYYTGLRGDYPWFADTIAIPAVKAVLLAVVGLPVVFGAAILATRRSNLPVSLWRRPVLGRPRILSAGLILVCLILAFVLCSTVISEPFIVPSTFLSLYLALAARAATASRTPDVL